MLTALAAAKEKLSQRQLEEKCGYSLGTVNKTVKEMTEKTTSYYVTVKKKVEKPEADAIREFISNNKDYKLTRYGKY